MLDNFKGLFRKTGKKDDETVVPSSGNAARERLHLVLMQDRVNVSVDFLDLMKEEIIQVIKKYIDVDEKSIDVRLTNQINEDGSNGSPALYANIPIVGLKSDNKKNAGKKVKKSTNTTSTKQNLEKKNSTVTSKKAVSEEEDNANNEKKSAATSTRKKTTTKKDKNEEIEENKTKATSTVQKKSPSKVIKKET